MCPDKYGNLSPSELGYAAPKPATMPVPVPIREEELTEGERALMRAGQRYPQTRRAATNDMPKPCPKCGFEG